MDSHKRHVLLRELGAYHGPRKASVLDPTCLTTNFLRDVSSDPYFVSRLRESAQLEGHSNPCTTLSWSKDGTRLISAGEDCRIKLWDPARPRLLQNLNPGHMTGIHSLEFFPDCNHQLIVSGGGDRQVRVTNLVKNAVKPFHIHKARVRSVLPLTEGIFLSAGEDGFVRQIDLRDREAAGVGGEALGRTILVEQRSHYPGPMASRVAINQVVVDPLRPYLFATGGFDPLVRVYDRRKLSLLPDSQSVSSGTPWVEGYLPEHWKRSLREVRLMPVTRSASITGITFTNDGQYLVASYSGDQIYSFNRQRHARMPEDLAWTPSPGEHLWAMNYEPPSGPRPLRGITEGGHVAVAHHEVVYADDHMQIEAVIYQAREPEPGNPSLATFPNQPAPAVPSLGNRPQRSIPSAVNHRRRRHSPQVGEPADEGTLPSPEPDPVPLSRHAERRRAVGRFAPGYSGSLVPFGGPWRTPSTHPQTDPRGTVGPLSVEPSPPPEVVPLDYLGPASSTVEPPADPPTDRLEGHQQTPSEFMNDRGFDTPARSGVWGPGGATLTLWHNRSVRGETPPFQPSQLAQLGGGAHAMDAEASDAHHLSPVSGSEAGVTSEVTAERTLSNAQAASQPSNTPGQTARRLHVTNLMQFLGSLPSRLRSRRRGRGNGSVSADGGVVRSAAPSLEDTVGYTPPRMTRDQDEVRSPVLVDSRVTRVEHEVVGSQAMPTTGLYEARSREGIEDENEADLEDDGTASLLGWRASSSAAEAGPSHALAAGGARSTGTSFWPTRKVVSHGARNHPGERFDREKTVARMSSPAASDVQLSTAIKRNGDDLEAEQGNHDHQAPPSVSGRPPHVPRHCHKPPAFSSHLGPSPCSEATSGGDRLQAMLDRGQGETCISELGPGVQERESSIVREEALREASATSRPDTQGAHEDLASPRWASLGNPGLLTGALQRGLVETTQSAGQVLMERLSSAIPRGPVDRLHDRTASVEYDNSPGGGPEYSEGGKRVRVEGHGGHPHISKRPRVAHEYPTSPDVDDLPAITDDDLALAYRDKTVSPRQSPGQVVGAASAIPDLVEDPEEARADLLSQPGLNPASQDTYVARGRDGGIRGQSPWARSGVGSRGDPAGGGREEDEDMHDEDTDKDDEEEEEEEERNRENERPSGDMVAQRSVIGGVVDDDDPSLEAGPSEDPAATGYFFQRYWGHQSHGVVRNVAVMGGGYQQYVVSGSDEGHIFIWDLITAKLCNVLDSGNLSVDCVKAHPYDPYLASCGADMMVRLWSPEAEAMANLEQLERNRHEAPDASHLPPVHHHMLDMDSFMQMINVAMGDQEQQMNTGTPRGTPRRRTRNRWGPDALLSQGAPQEGDDLSPSNNSPNNNDATPRGRPCSIM